MNPTDPRKWMWADALQMLERADRLHRQFFQVGARALAAPAWEPPVDILDSGAEIWMFFALPGVRRGDLEVSVESGSIVVQGERRMPRVAPEVTIRRLEVPYGRFERRIALPPGRFDLSTLQLEHGTLALGLRRID